VVEKVFGMSAANAPENDQRIAEILEVIFKLAFGDLQARASPGDQGDDIDAIMTGLNMLAEELDARVAAIEKANGELHQSEARFKAIFNNALDGIAVVRKLDRHIYMVNDAFCHMLGYSREELLSQSISVLHKPDDLPYVIGAFEKAATQSAFSNFDDIPLCRKDGSVFYTQVSGSLMELQGEQYVIGMFKDITVRKKMEEELTKIVREHRAVTDNVFDKLYKIDVNGNLLWWNKAIEEATGLTSNELLNRPAIEFFCEKDRVTVTKAIREAITLGYTTLEANFITKVGSALHEINGAALKDDNGKIIGITGVGRDISERRKSEEKLRQAAKVFECTTEGVIITDTNNTIVDVNEAFTRICGYSREEVIGKNPRILRSGRQSKVFYAKMWQSLQSKGYWKGEIWNRRKSGRTFPEWLNISAIRNDKGDITNYVGVFSDITSIKNTEQKLQHLAQHDPLTNLPNRLLFDMQLQHALERARRHDYIVGVMFLDLDRFKNINDSLGHNVGDKLLQGVAQLLLSCARSEDVVARLGGDEFMVILEEVPSTDNVAIIAQRILSAFKEPFNLDGHELYAGASIGISIYPSDGDDAQTLVKHADAAMYKAKEIGRSGYHFYSPELTARAKERLTLETAIRRALEREEFELYYQPQVSFLKQTIVGVEALIRWNRPGQGVVSPATFIPLAEETGLIVPLGEWVLQAACKQATIWKQQGLDGLRVAVNVSPIQLMNSDMVASVHKALKNTGLDPHLLELEVTEDLFMDASEMTLRAVNELKDIGVLLSIDDFGSGYSSLNYLKRLPLDKLKIDQSFVRDIPHHADDMAISRAAIALGHSLNLVVIAEGVETEQQLEFLRSEGCDEFQGYICSKPMPAKELVDFVKQNVCGTLRYVS
jgi:diguanylate cyclase (GGDEF)-like protein/PAS domain S-box-containing protein